MSRQRKPKSAVKATVGERIAALLWGGLYLPQHVVARRIDRALAREYRRGLADGVKRAKPTRRKARRA